MVVHLMLLALAADDPCKPPPTDAPSNTARPFVLHIENDSIRVFGGGDNSYTQGLQLHASRRNEWGFMKKVTDQLRPCHAESGQSSWAIGQTIFTPHNIITYSPPKGDRPFAGFLWVTAGTSFTRLGFEAEPEDDGRPGKSAHDRRVGLELSLGLIGPKAQGRTAQAAFHVLREARIPKGWYQELGRRPEIGGLLRFEDRILQLRQETQDSPKRWFDVTTDVRFVLGTMQAYAATAATARISPWHLPGFPSNTIPYSIDRSAARGLRVALVVGGEARGVFHNAFLGKSPEITRETWLTEWRAGLEFSLREWQLSYMHINRTREFNSPHPEIPQRHGFASIELRRGVPLDEPTRRLKALRGVRVDLRLGRGESSVQPTLPVDPELSLAASAGLEWNPYKRFIIGFEKTAVVREEGPPGSTPCASATPCHRDLFVIGNVVSVGVELLPRTSALALQARAGLGRAALKHQEVPDTGTVLEPSKDTFINTPMSANARLVGGRLLWRSSAPVSLALDGTWTRLSPRGSAFSKASFWTTTLGVQVHPFGRNWCSRKGDARSRDGCAANE